MEILRENEPNRFLVQIERDLRLGLVQGDKEYWWKLVGELKPNKYQKSQESYLRDLEYRIYRGIH